MTARQYPKRASAQSTFFASELDGLIQDCSFYGLIAEHPIQLGDLRMRCDQFACRHHRLASAYRGESFSRPSLRRLNRSLVPMPCLGTNSDALIPGPYASRANAAFSTIDQRRRSSLTVTASMVCLSQFTCIVLFLSVKITHMCPISERAILHGLI